MVDVEVRSTGVVSFTREDGRGFVRDRLWSLKGRDLDFVAEGYTVPAHLTRVLRTECSSFALCICIARLMPCTSAAIITLMGAQSSRCVPPVALEPEIFWSGALKIKHKWRCTFSSFSPMWQTAGAGERLLCSLSSTTFLLKSLTIKFKIIFFVLNKFTAFVLSHIQSYLWPLTVPGHRMFLHHVSYRMDRGLLNNYLDRQVAPIQGTVAGLHTSALATPHPQIISCSPWTGWERIYTRHSGLQIIQWQFSSKLSGYHINS